MANGYTTSFDCPNFYGDATKCNMLCNEIIKAISPLQRIAEFLSQN